MLVIAPAPPPPKREERKTVDHIPKLTPLFMAMLAATETIVKGPRQ